jgi:hypothetical protein
VRISRPVTAKGMSDTITPYPGEGGMVVGET